MSAPTARRLAGKSGLLAALVAGGLVAVFGLDGHAARATGALLAATFALYVVGFLATIDGPAAWFGRSCFHLVVLGQVLGIVYVYARSYLNHALGVVLPFGYWDLGAIVCLYAFGVRRQGAAVVHRRMYDGVRGAAVPLLCFALSVGVAAHMELPRTIMMSSDPDQHAFHLRQALRFGTIPLFGQFEWGPAELNYPGGFVALNLVWAGLSLWVPPLDIVQMQITVQAWLALCLMLETAARVSGEQRSTLYVMAFTVFALLYYVFPFGLQRAHWYLEGTGRLSSLALSGVVLGFVVTSFSGRLLESGRGRVVFVGTSLVLGLTIATAGLINVATAIMLLPFALIGLVVAARGHYRSLAFWSALALLCLLPLLIFMDPFYMGRVTGKSGSLVIGAWEAPAALSVREFASEALRHGAATLGAGREVLGLVSAPPASSGQVLVILAVSVAAMAIFRGSLAVRMTAALAALLATSIVVQAAMEAAALFGPEVFLLAQYTASTRASVVFLLLFVLTGLALLTAVGRGRLGQVVVGCAVLSLVVFATFAGSQGAGSWRRRDYPGAMGQVTKDDEEVLKATEEEFARYRIRTPQWRLDPPRILVPNYVYKRRPTETWLFPHGASRVLPHRNTFPLAFYYFAGFPEAFSVENYMDHVCRRFDREWLAARNIRYVFVPSDRGPICVHDLDRILEESRVVSVRNRAAFVELR